MVAIMPGNLLVKSFTNGLPCFWQGRIAVLKSSTLW